MESGMTLRSVAAAIAVPAATTALGQGSSLMTAPAGTPLVGQQHSPAGSGLSLSVGKTTTARQVSAIPKLEGRLLERKKHCFFARL
jgi:hypothetical protein